MGKKDLLIKKCNIPVQMPLIIKLICLRYFVYHQYQEYLQVDTLLETVIQGGINSFASWEDLF